MWSFLKSRAFFFNLLIAGILVLGILWLVFKRLDEYTLHGESITVPDLKGFELVDLDTFLTERKLRYIVADSVFVASEKKGVVLEQDPEAGESVKENRRIYLIVNAVLIPKVKLPKLIDLSLRQAITTLETYGFFVGELEYAPDFATNAVISHEVNGVEVNAGELVERGATIDLMMGAGLSHEKIRVPLIVGLNKEEALMVLKKNSLNGGGVVYDEDIMTSSDSSSARVWKQHPQYGESMINLGSYVDFWLTNRYDKIVLDSSIVDTLAPIDL
jgi:beta-lactam-binding protein with PASTA domain